MLASPIALPAESSIGKDVQWPLEKYPVHCVTLVDAFVSLVGAEGMFNEASWQELFYSGHSSRKVSGSELSAKKMPEKFRCLGSRN